MEDKLAGLEGVACQIDDVLIHGENQQSHYETYERVQAVLKHLADLNSTLNIEKCEFSKSEVKILGNIISGNGISPDPDKTEAILNLPAPKNIREVRFLGMMNQLSKFTDHLADKTKPLRYVLSKKNSSAQAHAQESAFKERKQCLIPPLVLALYDINRNTKVSNDTSKYGIGGVILQEQDGGFWKPVAYFSRAITNVESHYSPIGNECLGFTYFTTELSLSCRS